MTHHTASIGRRLLSGTTRPPVGRSIGFDWVMVVLGGWLLGGLYVDGWAHNHLSTTLERCFTPWHAAFSSGFMAVAGVIAVAGLVGWLVSYLVVPPPGPTAEHGSEAPPNPHGAIGRHGRLGASRGATDDGCRAGHVASAGEGHRRRDDHDGTRQWH
jgi:hypothetical protein